MSSPTPGHCDSVEEVVLGMIAQVCAAPRVLEPGGGWASPTSQSGTAASPPAAGGHTAAGESGPKAHRRVLAHLIKIWYACARKYQ
eukprot:COSAG02_NODE_13314_length_1411_cov_1.271341_1_plen_85_part_10